MGEDKKQPFPILTLGLMTGIRETIACETDFDMSGSDRTALQTLFFQVRFKAANSQLIE